MALTYGKKYRITRNDRMVPIFREGERVGEVRGAGFNVQVFGRSTGLTGTLLAAHAYAEIELGVASHNRRYVLSEAEYEEHRAVLTAYFDEIKRAYPYSEREKAMLADFEAKYANVAAEGEANMKREMMNLLPERYASFVIRETNPKPRPDHLECDEPAPVAPGM